MSDWFDPAADGMTYIYDPEAADLGKPMLEEGATIGSLVIRIGNDEARVMPCVAFTDSEGAGFIEATGEWQDARIVDDE